VPDDEIVYPFIFWARPFGFGIPKSKKLHGSPPLIRKVLILLISHPRDHSIHDSTILREDFIRAASGRLINLSIKFLPQAQRRCFAREDEIRHENSDEIRMENGRTNFIRFPSLKVMNSSIILMRNVLLFQLSWAFQLSFSFPRRTGIGLNAKFLSETVNLVRILAISAIIFKTKPFVSTKFIKDPEILRVEQRGLPVGARVKQGRKTLTRLP
jgi:hypothetical protein